MPTAIATGFIDLPLRPAPINPDWVIEGKPVARNTELFRSRDGLSCTVLWDCTPGQFEWRYDSDETIHILEGAVTLEDGINPPRRCGPGDIVLFPAGAHVRWTVESHVRKLAFFHRSLPRTAAKLVSTLRNLKRLLRPSPIGSIASV